ncbi:MAG: hypothetical protein HC939_13760 [Pleurocapsa sp. SU_5_0]|nr:hypothetical protein [Pleurocapsa sp. SU_5_0]NJO95167.1 hypothetical protein [Pleurocapsa sp. CRU_1_2]NJR47244.1 hypothetical protein [Hyellaceae cyanobacterium CSU_1_1]
MFSCKQSLLSLVTISLAISTLSFPALAQKIWQGKGRIISGEGEGASVGLKILVKDKQLTFLSGISQGQQIKLDSVNPLKGEIKTDMGAWRFLESEQELGVIWSQKEPYRLIHYLLVPVSEYPNNEGN